MRTPTRLQGLLAAAVLSLPVAAGAQNLVITNARILDGTGRVIERGVVVVREGKIASVSAEAPAGATGQRIDAGGKTVMPGFIDAHRHLVQGNPAQWLEERAPKELQAFLDAGFTTVLSAIDPPQVLEARKRIQQGQLKGPRLFAGTMVPLAGVARPPSAAGAGAGGGGGGPRQDPARTDPARGPLPAEAAPAIPRDATIKAVENAKQAGYDYLKTIINITQNGPEVETLKLIVREGKKRGLPTITHAVGVRDTVAAVEAMPAVLVHTPHIGNLGDDAASLKKIVDARIPMTSTLSVFVPHFGPDGKPLFRDAQAFPMHTISSAGQGAVNARLLWDAGIVSYGFGTDTQWPPKETLADELRALQLVFSPQDIVTIITKNAANSTLHSAEIGTLEPGKLADIVIIDGDPLRTANDLLKVVTTIKGGVVVFEAGK
jgi:imidazolonepropionase-like amidohydrolase